MKNILIELFDLIYYLFLIYMKLLYFFFIYVIVLDFYIMKYGLSIVQGVVFRFQLFNMNILKWYILDYIERIID